jgi:hypothetical protein
LFARVPAEQRKSAASAALSVAALCALFGFLMFMGFSESSEEKCTGHLWNKECVDVAIPMSERANYLIATVALVCVALACVWVAMRLSTVKEPSRRYHAILIGEEQITVQRIASIVDQSPATVRREIQVLIDSGEIDDFYLDMSADMVVSRKYIPKTSHKTVVVCQACKAHNEIIVGITKSCSYCRQPLVLRR